MFEIEATNSFTTADQTAKSSSIQEVKTLFYSTSVSFNGNNIQRTKFDISSSCVQESSALN